MLARTLAVLVPSVLALATLDCGGKTDTSLLPACPANGTCSGDCKQTITDCAGTHELACACDANGIQQCPELGMPNCQSDCDALMQGHVFTCSNEGEKCESPTQLACLDAPTLYCTCHSGTFVCDQPPSCPSPPSSCPAPDQVKPGAACAGFGTCDTDQQIVDCQGNPVGVVQCSCMGGTIGDCIAPPTPVCTADAGSPDGW